MWFILVWAALSMILLKSMVKGMLPQKKQWAPTKRILYGMPRWAVIDSLIIHVLFANSFSAPLNGHIKWMLWFFPKFYWIIREFYELFAEFVFFPKTSEFCYFYTHYNKTNYSWVIFVLYPHEVQTLSIYSSILNLSLCLGAGVMELRHIPWTCTKILECDHLNFCMHKQLCIFFFHINAQLVKNKVIKGCTFFYLD